MDTRKSEPKTVEQPNEMGLDKKTIAKFKKLLLDERQKIMNSSSQDMKDFQLSTDDLADETDHAVSELTQNLAISLRDRERSVLASIDAALERLESGAFGMCDACEEPIESKRLEARPMTTLCLSCKEAEEHRKKIFA